MAFFSGLWFRLGWKPAPHKNPGEIELARGDEDIVLIDNASV
jgi:hypothetical protein